MQRFNEFLTSNFVPWCYHGRIMIGIGGNWAGVISARNITTYIVWHKICS
jgi:hypothetical protein